MRTGMKSVRAAAFTAAMTGLILSGCSHTRSPADPPMVEDRADLPLPVADLMQRPDPHLDEDVAIAGYMAKLSLDEIESDLHVLTLELRANAPSPLPVPEPVEAQLIDFASPLQHAGSTLQDAANHDYAGFDAPTIERMAFKLRASSSRVRALSQYLQAKRFHALGEAAASVAAAYGEIGDAYATMSRLPAAEPLLDSPSANVRLSIADHPFESSMLSAGSSLNDLANSLLDARDSILARELLPHGELPDLEAAHLLLAYGSMMEGRSWEERVQERLGVAEECARMSEAFSLLGNGLAGMTEGLEAMSASLVLREPNPVIAESATAPTLRCTYVGYNDHILADVRRKVAQLGPATPVTVRGRVHRGNFREEVDTLWVHLDAVMVDGMTINVAYDDDSQSVRKFQNLISWIGDIDN
jgi:hypothetical protein